MVFYLSFHDKITHISSIEVTMMSLVKSIQFHKTENDVGFPYALCFFNQLLELSDVNIIIGDNGSGKSTLLELLSKELNLFRIGEPLILPKRIDISLKYQLRKPTGFYFSAEDFTSYIKRLVNDKREAKSALQDIELEYKDKSLFSKQQARSAHARTIAEIDSMYEKDLLTSSHGESYLSFFKSRLRPNQLFILDEPETPLSFENQLALIYMIHKAVKDGAQFIIATHSPMIQAFPNAKIFELNEDSINETSFDQISSVRLLKQFLDNPERFFHHLFRD